MPRIGDTRSVVPNNLIRRYYQLRGTRRSRGQSPAYYEEPAKKLPEGFAAEARKIGMSMVTTTVHDDYWMFIKLNFKMPVSPTDRDEVARAELELRRRQYRAVELFREYVPGCEKAFRR